MLTTPSASGGLVVDRSRFLQRCLGSTAFTAGSAIVVLWFPFPLYVLVVAAFILGALADLCSLMQPRGFDVPRWMLYAAGLLPAVLATSGWATPYTRTLVTVVFSVILFAGLSMRQRSVHGAFPRIALGLMAVLYVGWGFAFLIELVQLPGGRAWAGFLLLITKGTDMGAYVTGVRYGRTRPLPWISPKKSVEGAVGGLGVAVLLAISGLVFLPMGVWQLIALGVVLSVLAQVGDLFESLLKRDAGIKDSGQLVPAFGGTLDLIDSVLLAAPIYTAWVWVWLNGA